MKIFCVAFIGKSKMKIFSKNFPRFSLDFQYFRNFICELTSFPPFQDGAPSIFAGFGGFKSAASTESKAGFDFLAKKSSNGSSDSPAAATFNFSSPAASGFAFGQSPASKPSDSSSFSFGKNGSSSSGTKYKLLI